jgi:hypothetical protein
MMGELRFSASAKTVEFVPSRAGAMISKAET